jgi:hypothetical protein
MDALSQSSQPTRNRFGGGGGLGARIAAANGGQIPTTTPPAPLPIVPTGPPLPVYGAPAADDPPAAAAASPAPAPASAPGPIFDPSDLMAPTSSSAPPIEYDYEPFDADALFRDSQG